MSKELENKFKNAIWVAKALFDRGKVSGSSANLSFTHNDKLYITGSGTCFGNLKQEDFAVISIVDGKHIDGIKPSKELPLHKIIYENCMETKAVIHTHSFYSTLWSCLKHKDERDVMPKHTPYLQMKIGRIGLIPYAKPGSKELFDLLEQRVHRSDGYLLSNHGPVVGGKDIFSAFYGLEELEESARIAWHLKDVEAKSYIY